MRDSSVCRAPWLLLAGFLGATIALATPPVELQSDLSSDSAGAPATPEPDSQQATASPIPPLSSEVPNQVDIRTLVEGLLTDPARILDLVPMPLTPLDRWKTLQALSRLFSEARLESVTVEPADFQGENDRRPRFVRLVTRDVDLFGLDLDRLAMQAHEAVLDPVGLMSGKLVMIAPTPVKIEARVLEKDLDLAASTYTIRLRPGVFSLSGVDRFLFLKTRYELKAELRVNDANQLELDPRGLKYGIVPIPRPLVERVLASVNPLFDMDKFLGGLKTWVELKLVQPRLENEVMFARIQGAINPVASGSGSGVEGQGGRPLPGSTSPDSQPGPPPTRTGTQPAEHDQRPLTRAWSQ